MELTTAERRTPISAGPQVAIYHRVSTLDQDPTLADVELQAYAKRIGGSVVLHELETGSGASNARPGLRRVLEAAQRGRIDTLLVWKLDRWGRSAFDLLGNLRELEAAGVRFVAVTQGIDIRPGSDPMSRLLITMLSAVAEFERSLVVERTRLGIAKARASGKQLGRPPERGPSREQVAKLRREGWSWNRVALALGCSVAMARRRGP